MTTTYLTSGDVLMHGGMGILFGSTAACVRGTCKHIEHQGRRRVATVMLALLCIYIEAVITVAVMG